MAQVAHPSWQGTTEEFKYAMVKYAKRLLNEAIAQGAAIDDVQKKIGELNDASLVEGTIFFYDTESNQVDVAVGIGFELEITAPKEDVQPDSSENK